MNIRNKTRELASLAVGLVISVTAIGSAAKASPVELVNEWPAGSIKEIEPDVFLVDFGRVAFGNLELTLPEKAKGAITVRFGENLKDGRVDRNPPGTVRYAQTEVKLQLGKAQVVAPPADARNTSKGNNSTPPAVLTPKEWGVLIPFRWVEVEGWPGILAPKHVQRRVAFAKGWDDEAADFESSDEMLNRVWDLCKYSIKATTFAGVFVDGDRERIPYEADAYLNQLSYYTTNSDIEMPRDTFDHLMEFGTWPTEWAPHMVMMAHADWMQTGDREWLEKRYESLKGKMLMDRVGKDGLVTSTPQQIKKGDIVDWPKKERDGYVFKSENTVVNAFHIHALNLMAELAVAVGKDDEAKSMRNQSVQKLTVFQKKFFDAKAGLYRDGVGTDHRSLHANLFPLAFDLVPQERRRKVAKWLAERGMRCSVYAAQYYMEALLENGQSDAAIKLMLAKGDRSWRHMVESGATISWEAWDMKYKPNQDWNHAWGAAPANLLPNYILGVMPGQPGWTRAVVSPKPAGLKSSKGKVPTRKGSVQIEWENAESFEISINLPKGLVADVDLPAPSGSKGVFSSSGPVEAIKKGGRWHLKEPVSGKATFTVK